MPDVLLWIILIALAIAAIVAFCIGLTQPNERGAYVWGLIFVVACVTGGKWLHYASQGILEWSVTDVYPVESVTAPDDTYIQVYVVDANVRNATRQFGRVFPEGTVVHRLERPCMSRGVAFVFSSSIRYDLVLPSEGDDSNDVED